ncbi:gp53-like domain-containing protein, partial [Xenorhabdus doucetiae]
GLLDVVRDNDFEFNAEDNGYIRFPGGMMIQWCYGLTEHSGFGNVDFPSTWSRRCFGVVAINLAGGSMVASSIAGVQRVDSRRFRVSLKEIVGSANLPKPFFAIGVGQ